MKKLKQYYPIFYAAVLTILLFSCEDEAVFENLETAVLKKATIALTPLEQLGKEIYFDKISEPGSMSCADCHDPAVGFTGPLGGINHKGSVYRGASPQRFGNRKPPSAAYATFSPVFHYSETDGLFEGGNFWDGRATGEHFQEMYPGALLEGFASAEQAIGPFLNPVEMNNSSKEAVLMKIAGAKYADLWEEAFDEPISYENTEKIQLNYDRLGIAIAAFEASDEVNSFTSKFDYYMMGEAELTEQEAWGLELFVDPEKGNCAACHPNTPDADHSNKILFTDFTFDNIGVPRNPDNPFYDMDEVYLDDGSPVNPEGEAWIDYGLGGFLENHSNLDWAAMAEENMGKHKVPTLRNVGKKNGNGFVKAYMHNGVFKSLKEVVHFYNTRDIDEENWPAPEVPENVNTDELGDLGLTEAEEEAILAFLMTLSDGYKIK